MDILVKLFGRFFGDVTYEDAVDIDLSSTNFTYSKSFYLYVGVEGNVAGITHKGTTFSRNFTPGYHCIKLKQVTKVGTDATDLAACIPT